MAKILFFVCGVGLGHASRSSIILKELVKRHDVKVLTYSDGIGFLKRDFPQLIELEWFEIFFNGNKIDKAKTIALNFFLMPLVLGKNFFKVKKLVKEFNPEIIVSDFDINGVYAGKLFKLPVLLISNLHTIDKLEVEMTFWEKLEFKLTDERMLRAYDNMAKEVLVTSILKPEFFEKNFHSFHPIINPELLKQKTIEGNYFLIYMSKENLIKFLPILKNFETEKFKVYGMNGIQNEKNKESEKIEFVKNKTENFEKKKLNEFEYLKNIEFKKFSTKHWQKDIAECRAVLCHGGLLTLSEAVVLKKPCYVFATKNWFERFHNGKVIEKLGFGSIEEKPSIEGLEKFFQNIELFKKNLEMENIQPANEKFLKKLNELIEKSAKNGKV